MGLLESLGLRRRRTPPPPDPIFRFATFYDDVSPPYWEAMADFAPAGGAVEVLIDCPSTGASAGQHAFFRQLEARYPEALAAAHDSITRTLAKDLPGESAPDAASLALVCIALGEDPEQKWELSFEDPDGVHYAVSFRGWQAGAVEIAR
jgi:hypothetical protein